MLPHLPKAPESLFSGKGCRQSHKVSGSSELMAWIIYIQGMARLQTQLTIEWWSAQMAPRTPRLEAPAIPGIAARQGAESGAGKIIFFEEESEITAKQNTHTKKNPLQTPRNNNPREATKPPFHTQNLREKGTNSLENVL